MVAFLRVTLIVSWLLVSCKVHSFVAPHRGVKTTVASAADDTNAGRSGDTVLPLPPGRRTPRFVSFLFDDTLRLLNPKTMGTYQLRRHQQYGEIFKTTVLGKRAVFVTSKETLAALGMEEANSGAVRKGDKQSNKVNDGSKMQAFFPPHHQTLFGSQSLLVQSGATHFRLRNLIQPSLSPTLMKTVYQPVIEEAVDSLLRDLQTTNKGQFVAVVPFLRSFFVSIALRILLGESTSSNEVSKESLAQDLTIWSKGLLAPPLTFVPWSTSAKALRARNRICAKMTPLLEHERQLDQPSNSLLGRLVSSVDDNGNRLSNEDILDNVLTLIFAGSDTTASAAASLWMVLSLHPDLKSKLQENSSQARLDSLVQRVLEAYPPAPFSMRLAKEPLSIKNYGVPKGWLVVYGFAGALLSTKKESWETLGDEQVLKEENTVVAASTSSAFGTGPRMCPGRYLAVLELTTLCRKLLQYDWELKEDQNLLQTYTPGFFPKGGLQIRFD